MLDGTGHWNTAYKDISCPLPCFYVFASCSQAAVCYQSSTWMMFCASLGIKVTEPVDHGLKPLKLGAK